MKAGTVFLLFLIAFSAGAVAYGIIYFFVPRESPGRGPGMGSQIYVLIPVLVVPLTLAIGLLAYVILFPEISEKPSSSEALPSEQRSLEAIMRVLKDDERKVVELLINAGGSMLQQDIARKTGFTRVKTHRILHRLSTRGVVTAEKYYNTYRISLADWLRRSKE